MYPTAPLYESLARLQSRRSVKAMHLQEPAPSNTDLEQILQTAIRVPITVNWVLGDLFVLPVSLEPLLESYWRNAMVN